MFKGIKKKLIISVKNKRINVFLLFLVLSFNILILTKLAGTYTNTISFSINKKNVPEERIIYNDSANTLKITLKTHGYNLISYYFKKPIIDLDFNGEMTQMDNFYIWNKNTGYAQVISQFDKDIEIVNMHPDTLRFRFDKNNIKKVPIKLNLDISFSAGYDFLDSLLISPDSIKVVGPQELLSTIRVIETDTLRRNEVKTNLQASLPLKLSKNNDVIKYSHSSVVLNANVGKFTEGVLKVPITVKNVPDSISLNYFPKKVTISYYTSLKDFNSITADDFKLECDFNKVIEGQPYLLPEVVKKPKAVRNVKINQNQIEFIIAE